MSFERAVFEQTAVKEEKEEQSARMMTRQIKNNYKNTNIMLK